MSQTSMNKKNGVSLLELMTVVSLAGFLLLSGMTTFNGMIRLQNIKSSADQVTFSIKKARYYARSQGFITKIDLTTGNNTYTIEADSENITNNNNFDATSGVLEENIFILSNSCSEIYFNSSGIPVDSDNNPLEQNCSIDVGYDSQNFSTIVLEKGSGNVFIQ
ncbi:MAG: type II secretion system protein [Candidatus Gastranaerophilales bacterium]|nr:type II secretion system protein [Candidatus Gastranaerophilales bacterium]